MNNPPEKAKGYDPGLERSRAQDRKKAKGYDPGLERSRAQDQYRKNAKKYDLELERTLSQKNNLINNFRLFLRRNKFARLVANIVISLAWVLITASSTLAGLLIYAVRSFSENCKVTIFGTFCRKISSVPTMWDWALPTILIIFIFGPPLWLTWYLWIRKRLPKNK